MRFCSGKRQSIQTSRCNLAILILRIISFYSAGICGSKEHCAQHKSNVDFGSKNGPERVSTHRNHQNRESQIPRPTSRPWSRSIFFLVVSWEVGRSEILSLVYFVVPDDGVCRSGGRIRSTCPKRTPSCINSSRPLDLKNNRPGS